MASATGGAVDVGCRLHGHDILDRPCPAVARGPRALRREPGGEGHECPGRLAARADVGLGLGEEIAEGVELAVDRDRRVDGQAVEAALGEVADPLVGMPLAGRASLLDRRHHSLAPRPQPPAAQGPAIEQPGERRRLPAGRGQRELVAEGEDSMNDLPGAGDPLVEEAAVPGVGEGPVDPHAQIHFVAGPLGSHADRRVGRGAASWGRSDGDPRQDDQRQRWPAWQPTTTRVNRRGKRSVEGGHGDGQQALSPGREREKSIAHGLCPPLE